MGTRFPLDSRPPIIFRILSLGDTNCAHVRSSKKANEMRFSISQGHSKRFANGRKQLNAIRSGFIAPDLINTAIRYAAIAHLVVHRYRATRAAVALCPTALRFRAVELSRI